MEFVSVFLLFIEIFVSVVGISKWFTGCAYFVRGISVLENASLLFWFSFLVHGCAFLLPTL